MTHHGHEKHHRFSSLTRYARMLGFGDIHYKVDPKSGLEAIIAIHNTNLGPAIGGCRLYSYATHGQALKDVLRLAYGMTLKAAVVDLPHGGAKSVIIKPRMVKDREALFTSFGDFVEQMGGRYISAMDVGTTTDDMNTIATRTSHVIGTTTGSVVQGDPSPFTARGLFHGMEAAIKVKLNRKEFAGLTVAIQGGGKVGHGLAKHLHEAGAKIVIADVSKETLETFRDEFNAKIVSLDEIYDVDCDIFSPCAMGGTLNLDTINRLKAKIVAGCANNQLAHRKFDKLLAERGILYAPDFVVNAGGLIQAASMHDYADVNIAIKLVETLYDRTMEIFERAEKENALPYEVAEKIAIEKVRAAGKK